MFGRGFWERLWDKAVAPRVDPQRVRATVEQARRQLPQPVFWLLGKTQSGKTSIIRALTGASDAQIGDGFRACTKTARLYPFPDAEHSFVQFLDTRGLGEVDYDPADDMQLLADQAHLLLVVLKAADHAQECVLSPLRAIHRAHPQWPILVAQTTLHELYAPGVQHLTPYAYDRQPLPAEVPSEVARSLAAQRAWFDGLPARFVPVDFTLPGDGFTPADYGLEALWTAIEDVLPLGLRALLGQTPEIRGPLRNAYFQAAHPHVIGYALAAGAVAAIPVPIDVPLVLAIQGKMFHALASLYNQPFSTRLLTELGGALGTGTLVRYLVRLLGRDLLKLVPVPGLGSAASALLAGSCTYALGLTACAYFSYVANGDVPDAAVLREIYNEQFEQGRSLLAGYLRRMTGQEERPA